MSTMIIEVPGGYVIAWDNQTYEGQDWYIAREPAAASPFPTLAMAKARAEWYELGE